MAKIAFIQEELRARFGIMILSAVLKENGHRCDIFIQEKSKDIIGDVLDYGPRIIAFSTMSAGINFALDYARKLKRKSEAFILMGGPHPTFYPEILNEDCLDGICIGEGEYALLEFSDCIDKGDDFIYIKNLWIKKEGKIYKNDLRDLVDINKLPMYDREIYFDKYPELRNEPTKKFFVGRGCPFSCTYCFNHVLKKMYNGKGQYIRFSDIDRLIAEIRYVRDKYAMRWVQLNADTLNISREWLMNFLDKYKKEIDIPFICNVRIEKVDEGLVKRMKEAQCDRVDFGIEHGDEEIRKTVLKRDMTNQQIIEGGNLFNKYRIRVETANIVGVPHETVDTAMKTIEVNRQIRPELARCFVLQPYPKTEVYNYAAKHGFLDHPHSFLKLGTGFQIGFDGSAKGMSLKLAQHKELTNLYYFFDVLVKFKWLQPLIKILIKFPPNRLFLFIHAFPIVMIDVKYSGSLKGRLRSISGLFRVLIKK